MARKLKILVLIVFCMITVLVQSASADVFSVISIKELIVKHAYEMDIDPALALSIAKKESNFCHTKKSKYGAVGVFQLMPSTARKMGYNPYYLNDNIKGGIYYFKKMYKMFGTIELALAAYNAGPGNVKKYNGIPPFTETQNFVSSIMKYYKQLKSNPDPEIKKYDNKIKEINNKIAEENFRFEQDIIIEKFLASQGV